MAAAWVVIAAATVMLFGCSGTDEQDSGLDEEQIAYVCGETDTVCVVQPNGEGQRELNGSVNATNPAWAPSGTEIAFASLGFRSDGGGHWVGGDDLYLMNDDGAGLSQLTSGNSRDDFPAFSADGNSIVFASTRDLGRNSEDAAASGSLYRMDMAGGSITRLTDGPLDSDPSWSWASDKIAYVRGPEIWVVDADGTEDQRLIGLPGRFASAPAWSPDGTRLAFELDGRINVALADGRNPHPLPGTSDATAEEQDPTWSPDGTRIAFSAIASKAGCRALFVVAAAGGARRQITSCSDPGQRLALSPVWRPNHAVDES